MVFDRMEIDQIRELERYIGFPIKRTSVRLGDNEPHDETFSYGLCQRFYRKEDELRTAIIKANMILEGLLKKDNQDTTQIGLFYALIGNMYYILGRFNYAAGYFMKCLSYNKEDITPWFELLFSLRAMEEFELFEEGMFNFKNLYNHFRLDKKQFNQESLIDFLKYKG